MASTNNGIASSKDCREVETRLFINGNFMPSASGDKFEIMNTSTEKPVTSIYSAGSEDANAAVKAAKDAFLAWSALSSAERARYLNKLADAIQENLSIFQYLESISMGSPYEVTSFVADMALRYLRYLANKALDITGEMSLNTANFVNLSIRQLFGVCAGIIPWNASLFMLVCKLGPALAAGNILVLKSSEKSPLSSLVVARLCQETGFPAGAVNILSGLWKPCGEAIARHMDVRMISFTGSVATCRAVQKAANESNLKNVSRELGGKSQLLIFNDADLSKVVPAAALSILLNSGQTCMASSRGYVQAAIAQQFIEAIKATMVEQGGTSNASSVGVPRGPQADKLQYERVLAYVNHAKEGGLEVLDPCIICYLETHQFPSP